MTPQLPLFDKLGLLSAAAASTGLTNLSQALNSATVTQTTPDKVSAPFIHAFYILSTSLMGITFSQGTRNREGFIGETVNGSALYIVVGSTNTAASLDLLLSGWAANPALITSVGQFLRNKTIKY